MSKLQSTKAINALKVRAINNGGYKKNRSEIILACAKHRNQYGVDLTPKHI